MTIEISEDFVKESKSEAMALFFKDLQLDESVRLLKRLRTGSRTLSAALVERLVRKFGVSLAYCHPSSLFKPGRRARRNPLIFRLLRT
jgi:hypothetical protein